MKHIRPAIMLTILFVIVTGFIYPAIVTGIGQLLFNNQANGSIHYVNGQAIGSDLIGQYWTSSKYFHGRPSATTNPADGSPSPYHADNSLGSNLGPTNGALLNGNGTTVTLGSGTPVPANATPVAGQKNTYSIPGTYLGINNYAAQFRKENNLPDNAPLPADIVTASASGLDPDISPEAALLQVARVAQVRGLSESRVHQLVLDNEEGRFLWLFGDPHVNVLKLNLALDQLK